MPARLGIGARRYSILKYSVAGTYTIQPAAVKLESAGHAWGGRPVGSGSSGLSIERGIPSPSREAGRRASVESAGFGKPQMAEQSQIRSQAQRVLRAPSRDASRFLRGSAWFTKQFLLLVATSA